MSQWVSTNAVFDISVTSEDFFNVCNIHKIFDIVGAICMSELGSLIFFLLLNYKFFDRLGPWFALEIPGQ